jgi:hypothetical protein
MNRNTGIYCAVIGTIGLAFAAYMTAGMERGFHGEN